MNYKMIADSVMKNMLASGTYYEIAFTKPNFIDEHEHQYKSTYRFISYLIAPTMGIRDEMLDGKLLSLDDVKRIMSEASPYFDKLIRDPETLSLIERNYDIIVYSWE